MTYMQQISCGIPKKMESWKNNAELVVNKNKYFLTSVNVSALNAYIKGFGFKESF